MDILQQLPLEIQCVVLYWTPIATLIDIYQILRETYGFSVWKCEIHRLFRSRLSRHAHAILKYKYNIGGSLRALNGPEDPEITRDCPLFLELYTTDRYDPNNTTVDNVVFLMHKVPFCSMRYCMSRLEYIANTSVGHDHLGESTILSMLLHSLFIPDQLEREIGMDVDARIRRYIHIQRYFTIQTINIDHIFLEGLPLTIATLPLFARMLPRIRNKWNDDIFHRFIWNRPLLHPQLLECIHKHHPLNLGIFFVTGVIAGAPLDMLKYAYRNLAVDDIAQLPKILRGERMRDILSTVYRHSNDPHHALQERYREFIEWFTHVFSRDERFSDEIKSLVHAHLQTMSK